MLKGSRITKNTMPSCPEYVIKLRENYLKKGILKDYIVNEDILFKSPSAAAKFVGGSSLNGREVWKNKDGLSLNELENEES